MWALIICFVIVCKIAHSIKIEKQRTHNEHNPYELGTVTWYMCAVPQIPEEYYTVPAIERRKKPEPVVEPTVFNCWY